MDESEVSYRVRKIREGTRSFWDPKDVVNRKNKPDTTVKVGETDGENVCTSCGVQFDDEASYKKHMAKEHETMTEASFRGRFPFRSRG